MTKPPHEGCKQCPLYETGHYVPPAGYPNSDYLIVADSPGPEEVRLGKPFVGGAGKVFRAMVRNAGIDRAYVTHAVCCRPPNRAPSVDEVAACAPLLNDVLLESAAKVVIAVGRTSLERFIGKDQVSVITGRGGMKACWDQYVYEFGDEIPSEVAMGKIRGRFGDLIVKGPNKGLRKMETVDNIIQTARPKNARYVVACLHPAAVMRGWGDLPLLGSALLRAVEITAATPVYSGPGQFFTDPARFLVEYNKRSPEWLAFDIENDRDGDITDISFATSCGLVGSFVWRGGAKATTERLLAGEGPTAVAHNCGHDIKYLEQAGVVVNRARVHDTMMMAAIDEPDLRKALGHVAPRCLLMKPWKHKIGGDTMAMYNAEDSDVTARIYPILRSELRTNGQWDLFADNIMSATFKLMDFTERGIKVDPRKKDLWKKELEKELAEQTEIWNQLTEELHGEPVNPASPKQLAQLFYEDMGLPIISRTATKTPSTDKKTLEKLAKRHPHPIFAVLFSIKSTSKLLGTYAKQLAIGKDGCVHPKYLPATKDEGDFGAASGRLSSRDPNIQNQPHAARYMYVPHKPGRVIWARDYSQIEARLVAVFAGDEDLLRAYDEGRDLHQEAADYLTKVLGRPVSRKEAKGYAHGINYGMGPRMLAEHAGIKLGQARRVIAAFRDLRPLVFAWQDEVAERAARDGFIANPFGRRRNFPGFADIKTKQKHYRNSAVNMRPQSTVADVTLEIMAELDDALLAIGGNSLLRQADVAAHASAFVFTQIHDEFAGECDVEVVDEVRLVTKRIMEKVYDQIAPGWSCPTTFSCGPDWASCKDYENAVKDTHGDPYRAWKEDGCPVYKG